MHRALQSTAGLRRLSVDGGTASADVALADSVAVGALIPKIADALAATGDFDVGPDAPRYELIASGLVLDASKTLSELEIRDGTPLTLVRLSMVSVSAECDDAAEAVSAAVAAVELRWNRSAARLVGALVASSLAGAGAAVLWRTAFGAEGAHRTGCAGVAAVISVLALLAAAVVYRVGDDGAGLTLGLTATTFAALAGLCAVPGGPGAANAVFATAAAATSAVAVHLLARNTVIFAMLACLATTCSAAVIACVLAAAPPSSIGAGLAAVSLALVEVSPSLSVMLARLSPRQIELPDQLRANAIRAHTWLTGLTVTFSALAAAGAVSAATAPSPPHIVFATATGGVLLLRARNRGDIRQSAPPIVCGAITLSAVLVAVAVAHPHHAMYIAGLSMALSVVALYVGFMSDSGATERRSIELLQYFALATVAPLALWLCGFYGAARSLNLP